MEKNHRFVCFLLENVSRRLTFLEEILGICKNQVPIILATMTDQEVNLVTSINHEATIEDIEKIGETEFYKSIPYCPKNLLTKEQILW